jgi:hypothetical protein
MFNPNIMKALICAIIACYFSLPLCSQDHASYLKYTVDAVPGSDEAGYGCSMPDADQETIAGMRLIFDQYYAKGMSLKNSRNQSTVINVTAHRVMPTICAFPTLTIEEIEDDFAYTNDWFADIGLNVVLNLTINDICNNYYNELNYDSDSIANWVDIYNAHGVNGDLNVFYIGEGGSSSTFPWDNDGRPDNMFVHNKDHAGWGWTVAHEIGHWFGLYHTFQGNGSENVTRDPNDPCYNCETSGDQLCSTAADYGTDWCDAPADHCECTGDYNETLCNNGGGSSDGSVLDGCNSDPYDPDLYNIMAYGCRPCAHIWTGEQVDRQWVYLACRLEQASITHGSCNSSLDQVTPAVATVGQRVESSGYIISTQNIETHQYTLYDAASSVDLNIGFTVEYVNGIQPNFEVVNEGCYGTYQLNRPDHPGGFSSLKADTKSLQKKKE